MYHFFTGKCKWAKLDKPDEKYNKYAIDLYLDSETEKAFYDTGLSLRVKSDEEGKFVTFSRGIDRLLEGMEEKPKKLIRTGEEDGKPVYEPFEDLIGNGSIVTVKVDVYKLKSRPGNGHRLEAVAVEDLVVFKGTLPASDLPF